MLNLANMKYVMLSLGGERIARNMLQGLRHAFPLSDGNWRFQILPGRPYFTLLRVSAFHLPQKLQRVWLLVQFQFPI
jgi:hypothetical protein